MIELRKKRPELFSFKLVRNGSSDEPRQPARANAPAQC
jgi:hypothetical protein